MSDFIDRVLKQSHTQWPLLLFSVAAGAPVCFWMCRNVFNRFSATGKENVSQHGID